jgi:hypothetical protein
MAQCNEEHTLHVHAAMKTHDVVFRSEMNDDTEILFQGTEVECRIYVQGYCHALISETAYYIHPDSPGKSIIILYSPLVSQHKIHIWVEECQPVEDSM